MSERRVPVGDIVTRRLEDWGDDCIRDHATPALLLAVGHDEHAGEVHIYVPDDPLFDNDVVKGMLRKALQLL